MKTNRIVFFLLNSVIALAHPAKGEIPLSPSANEDSAAATFNKARSHLLGEGAIMDAKKAFNLMKEAAETGYPDAVGGMGHFYSTGAGGVAKDDAEAARWFRKGAELGSAKAMLNLGLMLTSKRTAPRDEQENGVQWIGKAANTGLPEAMHHLGSRYYFGDAVAQDYGTAYHWLSKAATSGILESENMVGVMLKEGLGVAKDEVAAEASLRKAAEAGHAKARSNLGHLIGPANTNRVRKLESLKWLMLAADQNEVTAIRTLQELTPHLSVEDLAAAREMTNATRPKLIKPQGITRDRSIPESVPTKSLGSPLNGLGIISRISKQ